MKKYFLYIQSFLLFLLIFAACEKNDSGSVDPNSSRTPSAAGGEAKLKGVVGYRSRWAQYVQAKRGLKLRSEPSLTSGTIKLLPYNSSPHLVGYIDELVTIDGIQDYWFKVKDESGGTGWIFGGYLGSSRCVPVKDLDLSHPFFLGVGSGCDGYDTIYTFEPDRTGKISMPYEGRGACDSATADFAWERREDAILVNFQNYQSYIESAISRNVGFAGPGTCFDVCNFYDEMSAQDKNKCDACKLKQKNRYGKLKTTLDITILLQETAKGIEARYSQTDRNIISGSEPWPAALPMVDHYKVRDPLVWKCFSDRSEPNE